jgi:predicted HTH domain antitoxin
LTFEDGRLNIHIYIHIFGGAMKRTNIMLKDDQLKKMKLYARKEGTTLGGLVRDAIDTVYGKKDALEQRKQVALSAYQEGFISLGKLAEVLGLDPVSARNYLRERDIPIHSQDREDLARDAENA